MAQKGRQSGKNAIKVRANKIEPTRRYLAHLERHTN